MTYVERNIHDAYGRDPAVIRAALVARGKQIFGGFSPDGQYHEPIAGIERVILDEADGSYGAQYAIDPYGLTVEINEETAGMQSAFWLQRANPGGIGAEDQQPGLALDFTDPALTTHVLALPTTKGLLDLNAARRGIHAMANHLRDYAFGKGPWTVEDPRASAMPATYFGAHPTWASLQGFYATSQTYASSMEAIWTQLVRIAGAAVPVAPVLGGKVPKPPVVTTYQSPNHDGYKLPRAVKAITYHIATSSLSSNISWFMNGNSGASANFEIAKDGTIYQYGDPFSESMWANGPMAKPDLSVAIIKFWFDNGINPNVETVSIEHEGEANDRLTPAQIASDNWLTAWLCQEFNLPVDRQHLLGHYQIDGINRPYCPSFDPDEWVAITNGALAIQAHYQTAGGTVPDPATRSFPDLGIPWVLTEGFKTFWEELEQQGTVLLVVGFPKGNAFDVNHPNHPRDGLPWRLAGVGQAQYFDRGGWIGWEFGEAAPYNFRVLQPDQQAMMKDLHAQLYPGLDEGVTT